MSDDPTPVPGSTELFRLARPRVTAIASIVVGVFLAGFSATLFVFVAAGDGALLGPASAIGLLALLAVVIGVLAFAIAARSASARSLLVPIRAITILAVAVGVVGAAVGLTQGAITGSVAAVGAGAVAFFLAIFVALLGARAYGAADHRPAG